MTEDELFEKYGGISAALKERLSPVRYRHTLGVAYTSAALAMRYRENVEKAFLAGLLHDAAKYMTKDDYLRKAFEFGLPVSDTERSSPGLLHAKLGAYFAEHEFGVTDPDILAAVRSHTTGHADMSLLEQIVCIADYIEPSRPSLPLIDELREYAFTDLDRACYLYAKRQIEFLKECGKAVDPSSEEMCLFYGNKVLSGNDSDNSAQTDNEKKVKESE